MTKLLTIGLLLLSCGVAEAGDPEFTMPKPFTSPDISAKITYCSNGRCETTCEAKMKEAMKLAAKHKDNLFTELYWKTTAYSGAYNGMRCITVECLQKELDAAKVTEREAAELKQAKIRWEAIYQECVK